MMSAERQVLYERGLREFEAAKELLADSELEAQWHAHAEFESAESETDSTFEGRVANLTGGLNERGLEETKVYQVLTVEAIRRQFGSVYRARRTA